MPPMRSRGVSDYSIWNVSGGYSQRHVSDANSLKNKIGKQVLAFQLRTSAHRVYVTPAVH